MGFQDKCTTTLLWMAKSDEGDVLSELDLPLAVSDQFYILQVVDELKCVSSMREMFAYGSLGA